MIQEVTGDILLSNAAVIAHGVAPNDDFHSGLALALRERWPAMYKDFRHYCRESHPKAGETWAWSGAGEHGPVRIVSLLTQEAAYGQGAKPGPAHIDHVNHSLRHLAQFLTAEKAKSVALPKVATGVGGLKWEDVRPLIVKHLGSLGIPVYLYTTYKKGAVAKETAPAKA